MKSRIFYTLDRVHSMSELGKDLYEAYPEFREVFDNVKLDF